MRTTKSEGLSPEHSASQPFLWPIIRKSLDSKRGLRLLDLGCGPGNHAQELVAMGFEYVGVDLSAEAVEKAGRICPEGRFLVADILDLSGDEFPAPFDMVLAAEVIEHLYHPRRLLQIARRCLRPGGTLILSTPYHGYAKNLAISILNGWDRHFTVLADGWHIKFFSPRTLRRMLGEEGFVDVRFRFGGRLPVFWKSTVCTCRRPA